MTINPSDLEALWITLKLAAISTGLLLLVTPPLAWWLAHSRARWRPMVEALVALPLILPPTVLGFYLLLLFSPLYLPGQWVQAMTGTTLAFSFTGLIIGSMIYSLPFVVQPLQSSFATLGKGELEAAATLGMSRWKRFHYVVFPMTRHSFVLAGMLGFAHTLGEFGVVLMIGGNIPGETQVIAIALFEHVEALDYASAHMLAGLMLATSLALLLFIYVGMDRRKRAWGYW
ncbi:molybdate ABC transporter, inner membrane subunit [Ferrimonas balearica DSM 9799]|uniref:Molybdenum transport system permease n=1 Tax=Ferrimonas balearica (strain DSM 9799 / CCM 4581 / KCTC 23876 / PAT) TaxID=550540 RepID=E1SPJ5_FERBD|nr:molybdate ABC transporter permease subunit [Ferrimonas balearica]MBY6019271.1 molybdate ABC transporter permease subunit [Halomonas denitrificans]ADN77812.1 molybdate ABC transporter, inner membrane subunit [Ferrimonas balearica DSM 9799]MBW3140821.1 molybdate ABC transporter permease subunit [Ferrimonas balearica]MBW3165976.1 molybdate ABC transporter permease subunit [Ferrimonas balearica]MBY5981886.1 molybdate ABC transporter permease subunit [Ferrimonas balearica]